MMGSKREGKLRAVDFFCGGGGMSLGMRKAGIEVLAGIDNDPVCRETYEANHKGAAFFCEDIKKMDAKKFGGQAGIARDDDGLIFIGCSPCQYWSIITGGADSHRKESSRKSKNLLGDFLRFVRYFRPGFVVVENVRGIERGKEDSGLNDLLKFFEEAKYLCDFRVLSVGGFGVPQTRQRFILIASRVSGAELPVPSKKPPPTVRDVIGGKKSLPKIKAGELNPQDPLHKSPCLSEKNIRRLKLTKEGGFRGWHDRGDLQIDAYRSKPKSFFRENYGRMAWDKPAPTITTKFFAISCGRFAHPEQNRAISLREGALLQTFPKGYKFKTSHFFPTARIIGNAVPPKFAEKIGRAIVKQWRTPLIKQPALG